MALDLEKLSKDSTTLILVCNDWDAIGMICVSNTCLPRGCDQTEIKAITGGYKVTITIEPKG